MTDHYDQREALYEANQQRAAQPITPQMFDVLYVLDYAGRVNGGAFLSGITCLTELYSRGLVDYECPSVGVAMWWITDAGKARKTKELATRTEHAPPLTAVLKPDAAERALFKRPHQTLAPLQGNLSDVLVPPPSHSHGVLPDGGHSFALHVHTGEHSHFHGVTEAGQHSYGIPGLTRAAPVELDPIAPGDEWPRSTPLKTPLRARVFYDGSLVIDNPARPLVVRPLRPDDMNGHTEEIVGTEVDAEAFIRAAIMLAQAMGERL
jgi:hypothetical protein